LKKKWLGWEGVLELGYIEGDIYSILINSQSHYMKYKLEKEKMGLFN